MSDRRDYGKAPNLRPARVLLAWLAIVCAVFVLWWWLA